MSRRTRKRNGRHSRRNNLDKPTRTDITKSESYEAGKSVGYNYRLVGPTRPVTITKVDPKTLR